MSTHLGRIHMAAVFVLAATAIGSLTAQTAQKALPVINVTVQYTGKSPVTQKTPIWVYLFNTTDPNAQTPPLAVQRLPKNGGVVQFEYGGTEPVYVFVALDREGGYDPNAGPPPQGTPIGSYSADGKTATAVTIAPVTNIKITFNDTVVYKP